MDLLKYGLKELASAILVTLFITLFVFGMNGISAPNAAVSALSFLAIAALIVVFIALMIAWGPLVQGEGRLPIRIPSAVGIPLGVALFVVIFVSGLGELLLHVPELLSPLVALAVAACILAGATILSALPPRSKQPSATPPALGEQAAAEGHPLPHG